MRRIIKAHELTQPLPPWQPDPHIAPASRRPRPDSRPSEQAASAASTSVAPSPPDASAIEEAARERGLAQGIRVAEESYRPKLAGLEAISRSLQQERAEFFTRIEPELVRLAITIAEKVIGRELELRPDTVVELVHTAVKRIRDRETLRVSVNPRDVDQVKQARDDLLRALDGVRKLDVIEDRRVDPGGCLIESPNGTLDARISTQVNEITNALTDVMPAPEEHRADDDPHLAVPEPAMSPADDAGTPGAPEDT